MILGCIHKNHLKITKKIAFFLNNFLDRRSQQLSTLLTLSPLPFTPWLFFPNCCRSFLFNLRWAMSIVVYRSHIYYYISSIGGIHNTCQIIRYIFWNLNCLGKTSIEKNFFFRALTESPNPPPWPQFGQLGPFFRFAKMWGGEGNI